MALPDLAERGGCRTIAFAYGEPVVTFQALVDGLEIVREHGFCSALRTAGNLSAEACATLAPALDAVVLRIDSFDELTARRDGSAAPHLLRDHLSTLRHAGVWVEVTTLLKPGFNDSEAELLELALSLKAVDGAIPWHLRSDDSDQGGHGAEQLHARSHQSSRIAIATARALDAAKRAGLEYVYAAEAPDSDRELTFCPVCRDVVLIERCFGQPRSFLADGTRCPRCLTRAHGLFAEPRSVTV